MAQRNWGVSGGPQFGLRQLKIRKNLGGGLWGPVTVIPSAQLHGIQLQTTSAELTGDDVITDRHSKVIAAQVTIRNGSMSMKVLQAILNRDIIESGVDPNLQHDMYITSGEFGYVGIGAKVNGTNGVGDTHFFAPKLKLQDGFELRSEYGQYMIPEITLQAVEDEEYVASGANEVQTVTITGSPTGGNFKLTFYGQQTANIAYNAAAADVLAALEALTKIGEDNVTVTGSAGGPYTVTFVGDLELTSLQLMTASHTFTGGTSPNIAVTQATDGKEATPVIVHIAEHQSAQALLIPFL